MDTKHKPRLNTQKNILGPMKVIFLLVLFSDYKLVRLSKNVIVLSLSDEEALDRGFDLGGF